jgi:hypothetical protein
MLGKVAYCSIEDQGKAGYVDLLRSRCIIMQPLCAILTVVCTTQVGKEADKR